MSESESENIWRTYIEKAPDVILVLDQAGTIQSINRVKEDQDPSEVIGKSCLEYILSEYHQKITETLNKVFLNKETIDLEFQAHDAWYQSRISPIIKSNIVVNAIQISTDITEKKKSEEKYHSILSSVAEAISIIDKKNNIIWANKSAKEMFGSNMVGKKCFEVYQKRKTRCEPYPCPTCLTFYDNKPHKKIDTVINKNNIKLHMESSSNVVSRDNKGNPEHIVKVTRDITKQKELETQLLQSQKLESLGRLTRGIAHDFNNLLNAIVGNATLLQMHEKNKYADNILKISENAAQLIKQLMSFSRQGSRAYKQISINDLIKKIIDILESGIIKNKIIANLDAKNDVIMGDQSELQTVIMNIVLNARDAMPQAGSIQIITSNKDNQLIISISDTGVGIPEENLNKIFDPFFTTKEMGKGTGLGLASAYGAIKNHNGSIQVESIVGKGTTFFIHLPLNKV